MTEKTDEKELYLWEDWKYRFIEVPVNKVDHKKAVDWKYWNVTGLGIYIVAVVNFVKYGEDLKGFDWAAYIGGSLAGAQNERDGYEGVMRFGGKLSKEHASFLFPQFATLSYRQ